MNYYAHFQPGFRVHNYNAILFHANKSPIFLVVCQNLDEKIVT